MNRLINNGLDAIRPYRAIIIVVALLLAAVGLFFYGPLLVNKIGDKWFHASTDKDKTEIQQQIDEANRLKGERDAALKAYVDAKQELATERVKREAAEKLYEESKQLSQQARKDYEAVLNTPAPTPLPSDSSVADICTKARSLGVGNLGGVCPN